MHIFFIEILFPRAIIHINVYMYVTYVMLCNIQRKCLKDEWKMAVGESGRLVVEIDPNLKKELHQTLREDGTNLKDW